MGKWLGNLKSKLRSLDFEVVCVIIAMLAVTFAVAFFIGSLSRSRTVTISTIEPAEIAGEAAAPDENTQPNESGDKLSSPDERININTADILELTHIPGVGEATARKIIAFREEHGDFTVIEEIMLVSGIGEKKFELMRDYITV